jgi:tRNA(adenine34) deaminase
MEEQQTIDLRFMQEALKEAKKAYEADEVPVGAVIVCRNTILARAHNYTEHLTDVTAHAEMQAFTAAASGLGGKYLPECTLYVTLEPCVMCAGASFWTQIGRVVYGASDEKRGFLKIGPQLLHPKTQLTGGVLEEECATLLKDFFKKKRLQNGG